VEALPKTNKNNETIAREFLLFNYFKNHQQSFELHHKSQVLKSGRPGIVRIPLSNYVTLHSV
jgi:hypothetical protein